MKWFGRKAGRAGARPFLLRGWPGLIAGEPWPRSYEAQLREAYLHNPVAQRAVKLVAEGLGGASVYACKCPDARWGWRLVTMQFVRSHIVRPPREPWASIVEFRARLLAV